MADVDVGRTLGLVEIGISVSLFLFGVSTIQLRTYRSRFPDDSLRLKAFVSAYIFRPCFTMG